MVRIVNSERVDTLVAASSVANSAMASPYYQQLSTFYSNKMKSSSSIG